jgi:hypothetical protein
MVLLLFDQFASETQSTANVFKADSVLPLYILERHSARKAANYQRHWQTCPAYHRLAVTNLWINHDSVVHEAKLQFGGSPAKLIPDFIVAA